MKKQSLSFKKKYVKSTSIYQSIIEMPIDSLAALTS